MSTRNGIKIVTLISAANGDTYGDAERQLFRTFQALVMPNVISMTAAVPGSPTPQDTYVVPVGAGGTWTGQDNKIAVWSLDSQDGVVTTGAWEYYAPLAGWEVYDNATGAKWKYTGTKWVAPSRKVVLTETGSAVSVDCSKGNSFVVTIDHTQVGPMVVTIINPQADGQEIELLFIQDSTGGITVTLPGSVKGSPVITTTASKASTVKLTWDNGTSTWYTVSNTPNQ